MRPKFFEPVRHETSYANSANETKFEPRQARDEDANGHQ